MVSNFNTVAQHTMKERVYSKLTEELHDQEHNRFHDKRKIHQVDKQWKTTKLRKLQGTIKCST
jgi:transcription initiation factor TFIIIB Brf1 subunit/transcription initiation factor TFIIB